MTYKPRKFSVIIGSLVIAAIVVSVVSKEHSRIRPESCSELATMNRDDIITMLNDEIRILAPTPKDWQQEPVLGFILPKEKGPVAGDAAMWDGRFVRNIAVECRWHKDESIDLASVKAVRAMADGHGYMAEGIKDVPPWTIKVARILPNDSTNRSERIRVCREDAPGPGRAIGSLCYMNDCLEKLAQAQKNRPNYDGCVLNEEHVCKLPIEDSIKLNPFHPGRLPDGTYPPPCR